MLLEELFELLLRSCSRYQYIVNIQVSSFFLCSNLVNPVAEDHDPEKPASGEGSSSSPSSSILSPPPMEPTKKFLNSFSDEEEEDNILTDDDEVGDYVPISPKKGTVGGPVEYGLLIQVLSLVFSLSLSLFTLLSLPLPLSLSLSVHVCHECARACVCVRVCAFLSCISLAISLSTGPHTYPPTCLSIFHLVPFFFSSHIHAC